MVAAILDAIYLLEKRALYSYIEKCSNFKDKIFAIFLSLLNNNSTTGTFKISIVSSAILIQDTHSWVGRKNQIPPKTAGSSEFPAN